MKKMFLIFFILSTTVLCQEGLVRGKITYVTGDAVYTSLGRNVGVQDSSLVFVMTKADTVAKLRVFAVSSKSSVCRIITTSRPLNINDAVIGIVLQTDTNIAETRKDSTAIQSTVSIMKEIAKPKKELPSQSLVSVQGRISAQYFTYRYSNMGSDIAQPSIVVNLRGKVNNSPIRFEMYGNFRSISSGSSNPFSSNSVNQTRIYKISLDYDDSLNCISLGRIIPLYAASAGYIDGAMVSRRFGNVIAGTAFGFEPNFSQRTFSTDMKKFSIFAAFNNNEGVRYNTSITYSKRFYKSALDRELVSASFNIFPFNSFFLYSQANVDLRSKSGSDLIRNPRLSFLIATLNYRMTDFLSLGGGINSSRPSYSFSTIATLPDTLIDQQLRTNPYFNITANLPGGLSLNENYSPMSSEEGFGKEYFNYGSIGLSNFLNQGIMLRTTMNINATTISTTNGYGASAQKSFGGIIDLTVRYQWYRYNITHSNSIDRSKSLALDFMVFLTRNLTLWGSYERITGTYTNGNTILSEFSWRF